MIKKSFFLRNVATTIACLAVLTMFSGCGTDKADNAKAITVASNGQLTQTVFADKTEGASSVNITTSGAWTSTIAEKTATKAASAPSWINILPDHGDAAGQYAIQISLSPNTTRADRTAVISLSCEGTEIAITVTQKKDKEDGTVPEQISRVVTGQIVELDTVNITAVKLEFNDDELSETLVSAPCANGAFTITLPETIDNRFLVRFGDVMPNTMNLSDNELRVDGVGLYAYSNDVPFLLSLRSADGKVQAELLYADRDCVMSGSTVETEGFDEPKTIIYNLILKAGWNWAYLIETDSNITVVSTKPNVELQWYTLDW